MESDDKFEYCFNIINENAGEISEDAWKSWDDNYSWVYLGMSGQNITERTEGEIREKAGVNIPDRAFRNYHTVGKFKAMLRKLLDPLPPMLQPPDDPPTGDEPQDPWQGIPFERKQATLSYALHQRKPETASKVVFLFPDGSGAGLAYSSLPDFGEDVCMVGMNSPFIPKQTAHFNVSIRRMARLWLAEVRRLQPKGKPYILGGWSAGGFYAFEVAHLLIKEGEKVEKLILIDSPCRLYYEALSEDVIKELTKKGLMGASGERKAAGWLVEHFSKTVIQVGKYWPKAFEEGTGPSNVHFIWVREGLVKSVTESGLEVDMSEEVTKFLLEPRPELKDQGWGKLLPGSHQTYDYTSGNHFTITQGEHAKNLGQLLKKVVES